MKNRMEISRTESHHFLYLIRSNPYFFVRLHRFRFRFRISNVKVENGLDIFWLFFTFLFLIWKYPKFKIGCRSLLSRQLGKGKCGHWCPWTALYRQLTPVAPPWVAEVGLITLHGAACLHDCIWLHAALLLRCMWLGRQKGERERDGLDLVAIL
jgi:hypothetical protein